MRMTQLAYSDWTDDELRPYLKMFMRKVTSKFTATLALT